MQVAAENEGLFRRLVKTFRLEREAKPGDITIDRVIRPVYNFSSKFPMIYESDLLFLQHIGDETARATMKHVLIPEPVPADLHGQVNYRSGTTTAQDEDTNLFGQYFLFLPRFTKKPIIQGDDIELRLLLGVVSDNAIGVATIHRVGAYLLEADQAGTQIEIISSRDMTVDIAVTGTTELKESVLCILPAADYEFQLESNLLKLGIFLFGKSGDPAHTTTGKLYFTAGSNDSYIKIPFL
jgi:hypothetical protein